MAFWEAAARFYFSHVPIDKGKWRAWKAVEGRFDARRLPKGKRRLPLGFWMTIDPEDSIGRFIYFWGCWEPNETHLIERILSPGDTFVDVGANIGYFTLIAARLVGPTGKVIAIEATPPTAERLRQNIALNAMTNVLVEECAVGCEDGIEVRISQVHAGNCGMNSMRPAGDGPGWNVPCRRLDHLLPPGPIRLVKMDVEGAELLALQGFGDRLAAPDAPDLLVEVTPGYMAQFGHKSGDLYDFVRSQGYDAYLLRQDELTPVVAGGEHEFAVTMMLFSKRQSAALHKNHSMKAGASTQR